MKEKLDAKKTMLCSPDLGAMKRVHNCQVFLREQKKLSVDLVVMDKIRKEIGEVAEVTLIKGQVTGKDILLVDDICDSGGTLMKCADVLKKAGAHRIYCFVTHGLFNGDFYQAL